MKKLSKKVKKQSDFKKVYGKKEYCVHIYPQYHEVENIMATSAGEAEVIAMNLYNRGDYSVVGNIEVMRVCSCSTDSPADYKKCDNCGKKL
jgi:hypothetical protein